LNFTLVASLLSLILRPFGCKYFVPKCGNLDNFESCSFDGILLGYTPYGRSYQIYNFETNIIIESCDVTFDETAPCPCDVVECTVDKEMEESIFIDKGLKSIDGDKDESPLPSTSSLKHVLTSTLETEAPQFNTTSTTTVKRHGLRGRLSPSRELSLTFRRHIHLSKS
jgi:hypothetical protein